MEVKCTVSLGELVDKLTILEIKMERIDDQEKVKLAGHEHKQLSDELSKHDVSDIDDLRSKLKEINSKLWVIEDDIRERERQNDFTQEFIRLARAVYFTNDERFKVKNTINLRYNSDVKEVKSYKEY